MNTVEAYFARPMVMGSRLRGNDKTLTIR